MPNRLGPMKSAILIVSLVVAGLGAVAWRQHRLKDRLVVVGHECHSTIDNVYCHDIYDPDVPCGFNDK